MPYKKKAPAKRTKKAVGGALSAAQKRLLGQAQAGAVKKGAGAITKQIVNYTRKHGDQRKAASAPAKGKTGSTASSKRAAAMMALGNKQRAAAAKGKKKTSTARGIASRGRSIRAKTPAERMGGQLARQKRTRTAPSTTKQRGRMTPAQRQAAQRRIAAMRRRALRPAVGSTRPKTPAQRQALMKKRMETMRRGRVVSTRPPSRRGRLTAAQRRARMIAARRRAMAAARKRRAPSRRRGPTRRIPTTRRAPLRGRGTPTYRSPSAPNRKPSTSRRRSGLRRAVRTIRKAFR